MSEQKKTKRKLSNIDFSKDGAHIALCHSQQGVANMQDFALVMKSKNFSDEFIEKIQQVKVTLEFPEFLRRFFSVYYEDAEVLAAMLGYEKPEIQVDEPEDYWKDYVESRLQSFEILKSAAEAENLTEVMANLSEDQYLAVLQDQEQIEKALASYDKKKKEDTGAKSRKPRVKTVRSFTDANTMVAKSESTDVEQSTAADVSTSTVQHEVKEGKGIGPVIEKLKTKEKLMTQDVKIVEQVVETEMVEKSAFESIQKQAQEQAELLKSALAELEVFKAEKQAMIAKSRKQAVVDAVKDEAKAEQLFKAVGELADEQFEAVVSVVKSLSAQVEQSDLFVEKGATVDSKEDEVKESAVAKLLKAQLQAGK